MAMDEKKPMSNKRTRDEHSTQGWWEWGWGCLYNNGTWMRGMDNNKTHWENCLNRNVIYQNDAEIYIWSQIANKRILEENSRRLCLKATCHLKKPSFPFIL